MENSQSELVQAFEYYEVHVLWVCCVAFFSSSFFFFFFFFPSPFLGLFLFII